MTTPISLLALSGLANNANSGTVIYAYYNAFINLKDNPILFNFSNTPTATLRNIYLKKSGFYMAIFLPSVIAARNCSILFYYNATTNLATGHGTITSTIFGLYIQIGETNMQIGDGIGGYAPQDGPISLSLYIIRVLTVDIPSSLLPNSLNASIPNGSGGRTSVNNSEYRNPNQ
jgi:hypothetical protein